MRLEGLHLVVSARMSEKDVHFLHDAVVYRYEASLSFLLSEIMH